MYSPQPNWPKNQEYFSKFLRADLFIYSYDVLVDIIILTIDFWDSEDDVFSNLRDWTNVPFVSTDELAGELTAFKTRGCRKSSLCWGRLIRGVAVISAKNHKRQRRKRQSVTAKRQKSQTPKVLTAIVTLPNLT